MRSSVNPGGLVRTARGEYIDMNKLRREHEKDIAVTGGGISMNSRGDLLGRGAKIVRTREQVDLAYHATNQKATQNVSLKKPIIPDDFSKKTNKEEFTLDEVSSAILQSEQKRKRKTTLED